MLPGYALGAETHRTERNSSRRGVTLKAAVEQTHAHAETQCWGEMKTPEAGERARTAIGWPGFDPASSKRMCRLVTVSCTFPTIASTYDRNHPLPPPGASRVTHSSSAWRRRRRLAVSLRTPSFAWQGQRMATLGGGAREGDVRCEDV